MFTVLTLAFVLAVQAAAAPSAGTDIVGPPEVVIDGAYLPRISPDGRLLAYATTLVSEDDVALQVKLRDLRTGSTRVVLGPGSRTNDRTCGFSAVGILWADARRLRVDVAMCDGGTTYVLDTRTGRLLRSVDSELSGDVPDTYSPFTRTLYRSKGSRLTMRFGGSNTESNHLIPQAPSTLASCRGENCEDVGGLDGLWEASVDPLGRVLAISLVDAAFRSRVEVRPLRWPR